MKTMNKSDRRNYLLGRISMANEWIDFISKKKTVYSKQKLKEAKQLRDEDMNELKELG